MKKLLTSILVISTAVACRTSNQERQLVKTFLEESRIVEHGSDCSVLHETGRRDKRAIVLCSAKFLLLGKTGALPREEMKFSRSELERDLITRIKEYVADNASVSIDWEGAQFFIAGGGDALTTIYVAKLHDGRAIGYIESAGSGLKVIE